MSRASTLTAAAALVALLAACGGGGSTAAPPVATPAATATSAPVQTINNFTGPSSQVTVSITVPTRAPAESNSPAQKIATSIRSMANTSPSAAIRARAPQFVSPGTQVMEFVLSNANNDVLVDDTASCNSSNCTSTFTVPVGSGFTATLYLYDGSGGYLIAAGTTSNVTVVLGANPGLTIVLNGIAAYVDVETDASTPFFADPSQAQTFHVTMVAEDADRNPITTPGVLLNSSFEQITSIQLAPDQGDVTPNGATTVAVNPNLSLNSTSYTYAGTGSEPEITWSATAVTTGGAIVPSFYSGRNPASPSPLGQLSESVTQPALSWTNTNNYPQQPGDPHFTGDGGSPGQTFWQLEFPNPANSGSYTFGIDSNVPGYSGNVTISDNGSCAGVLQSDGYSPSGSRPYSALSTGVTITMNSNAASGTCELIATDNASRNAFLEIHVDQSTFTIERHARSTK
jgi:hypothetical protein